MILRDYRTGGGRLFMPLFSLWSGPSRARLEHRGSFRTSDLPAAVGVAGFLKPRGPKDWTPRDEPEGFRLLLEISKGDTLQISGGANSARWTFGMPGLFGTVLEGSGFFGSLYPKPKSWWTPEGGP